MRRLSAASTAAATRPSTAISGRAARSVAEVPETCWTSSRASSSGVPTPAASRLRRASRWSFARVLPPAAGTPRSGRIESGIRAEVRQELRLMIGDQRRDDLVELAKHHPVELVERQVDPVIRDAALRKIVGADA